VSDRGGALLVVGRVFRCAVVRVCSSEVVVRNWSRVASTVECGLCSLEYRD